MSESEPQLILDACREELLLAFPSAWAIYVYGSFARGDETPVSDVDLAVLLPADEIIVDPLSVASVVATRVHRDIDLVDMRRISDVLRREILSEGMSLYVALPDQVLEWEGTAMSRYQRYRREVRDLLEDFAKTGVGYAR